MNFSVMLLQGGILVPIALVLILVFVIGGFVLARVFAEAVRRDPNRPEEEERREEEKEEDSGEEEEEREE